MDDKKLLSMKDAVVAMQSGKVIGHSYGEDNFFIMDSSGRIFTEEGYDFTSEWKNREGETQWQTGFYVLTDEEITEIITRFKTIRNIPMPSGVEEFWSKFGLGGY